MTGWANEVQAGVYSEINLVGTAWLLLLKHVGFVLIIKELHNWHPRVSVVDIVTEAGSINDGESDYPDMLD